MERRYLLGNEAIAHACVESGVDFISGYPGTPSSEVIDTLRVQPDRPYYVEWSVNEKVALENALAAAWCGVRALCTMKHVGLNVAADPLMTSAYTGVTGGLVIMSADDPFAHSSQNEQDTRCYAHFARVPCLDPASVQEAHDMILEAFPLSEEFGVPVIFRPTTRICHSKGDVDLGPAVPGGRKGEFHKDPRQYVVIPAHTRVLHKKLNEKQPAIRKRLVEKGFNRYEIRGKTAIIASGIGASYVQELLPAGVSFMKIGAYPIDEEWLGDFVRKHEKVLVIEELAPEVEEIVRQVAGTVPVFGKKNGYAPYEGELSPATVAAIMEKAGFLKKSPFAPAAPVQDLPPRPPILCAGCLHRGMFYAMKKVFKDAIYPSDIGCYTLGLQLGTVDTCICMGASITVASGIAHSGEPRDIICTIGDSTFLHTGIQGLMNAVYNGADMTVVILDNRITAMTGHQPNPNSGATACGVEIPAVSLDAICRACGVTFVETVDPFDITGTVNVLQEAKKRKGVKVIIARQMCVITARRAGVKRGRYTVDAEACTGCGTCVRFGCPAIEFSDEKARINDLCSGCSVCAQLCPAGAIGREGKK
ncbi:MULTISPECIES: indolepyruvate ferredoxin oxidoreductase subunit alpha [unclassified Methanoregula]|uniref:indolepyruvate ferredoxin oxidoreductase subunit alpha n=1 Tax=unclassified Methanoregula TaxID=2649730 RepID=UPI0009CD5B1E|nr:MULTISPECIES: indolepyruvate ferredoxin oxidoreductase subunit alpha [unclassified Methanoregula]OPX61635.1 MAG: Indolepyruvate oxidoreductase subunit IorA [Methanoregula sp. PtaB.Bin085]OPY34056.1 MAG: Indolepyruvate oxidoreductase subunit IorA [Methanoregula sp. PtaU1.Bin006]